MLWLPIYKNEDYLLNLRLSIECYSTMSWIKKLSRMKSLRPSSSGKGMGRVCGRFQVKVSMGMKIYPSIKKKKN